jgi:triphosphoribosyl-dephospho-CoA synthase
MPDAEIMSVGQMAQLACVLEVTAPKAGNVHPGADFADTTWRDFITSAEVIRPIMDRAGELGVGPTVLQCVQATRQAVGRNTNLGIVLLFAPLCAAAPGEPVVPPNTLGAAVRGVLQSLTQDDADAVYEAIRLASPGGLGSVARQDVRTRPTVSLVEAMRLAAHRDAIARQYVNGFHDVLHAGPRWFPSSSMPLDQAIVRTHLQRMADEPDSLIQRKCGLNEAVEAHHRAKAVLDAGWPDTPESQALFDDLDAWLREGGNRRNPGTSADLVAAGLLAAFRYGWFSPPFDGPPPLPSLP